MRTTLMRPRLLSTGGQNRSPPRNPSPRKRLFGRSFAPRPRPPRSRWASTRTVREPPAPSQLGERERRRPKPRSLSRSYRRSGSPLTGRRSVKPDATKTTPQPCGSTAPSPSPPRESSAGKALPSSDGTKSTRATCPHPQAQWSTTTTPTQTHPTAS